VSDRDLAAIECVSKRATAVTTWVAAAFIVPGALLIVPLYWASREIQFAVLGVHVTYVSGVIAVALGLGPAVVLARWVSRLVVRARRGAWIEQAADQHGIPASVIAEFFGDWN